LSVGFDPPHPPPQLGGVTGGGFEHAPVLNDIHPLQLNVHKLYQKFQHVCPLRADQSHSSPVSIILFPQTGSLKQLLVSIVHEGEQVNDHQSYH